YNFSSLPIAVTIVFPRGYDASIVKIKLYQGRWIGTSRSWSKPMTIDVTQNMVELLTENSITGDGSAVQYVNFAPTRTVREFWGPGTIMWTDLNNPFIWPETNLEVHS